MPLQPLAPIHTAHLFAPLHRELMTLLRGLSPDDWLRPTVAGDWRVRDVAAHLLEVDLRHLSVTRDGHVLPPDRDIAGHTATLSWTVTREPDGWRAWSGSPDLPPAVEATDVRDLWRARVRLVADDVWRVFYNALDEDAARRRATVEATRRWLHACWPHDR